MKTVQNIVEQGQRLKGVYPADPDPYTFTGRHERSRIHLIEAIVCHMLANNSKGNKKRLLIEESLFEYKISKSYR